MRRGQCLSDRTTTAFIAMMRYYLFRSYRIWGSRNGGGKTPVSVHIFLNIALFPF